MTIESIENKLTGNRFMDLFGERGQQPNGYGYNNMNTRANKPINMESNLQGLQGLPSLPGSNNINKNILKKKKINVVLFQN